jgi:hypothetical protein
LTHDVVVYTALTAGRDVLRDPEAVLAGVDYVCFTDTPIVSDVWRQVPIERGPDPGRTARRYKILSHRMFPDHRFAIYHDACMRATDRVLESIDELDGAPFGAFRHPLRSCVYDEAEAVVRDRRERAVNVAPQVARYRAAGMPAGLGLFENAFLVREHTPDTEALNELWWAELSAGCVRDQVSLPYALWRLGTRVHAFEPGTQVDNRFIRFDFEGHRARLRLVDEAPSGPDPA